MVIEVVDNLNWESPIIFYSKDQDIVLWQDFKSRGFLQPQFIKIPQFDDYSSTDQKLLKILLSVKHKRASTTLNLILFVDQLHIATAFLQSIEFFCLFSRKNNLDTEIVADKDIAFFSPIFIIISSNCTRKLLNMIESDRKKKSHLWTGLPNCCISKLFWPFQVLPSGLLLQT